MDNLILNKFISDKIFYDKNSNKNNNQNDGGDDFIIFIV